MNAKTTKRIRKLVYGEYSHRARNYGVLPRTKQLVCRGLRERYQAAKRFYLESRAAGRSLASIWATIASEGENARSKA